MTQAFSDAERAAVYRVVGERRDMRHFAGGTVDPVVLRRLLELYPMTDQEVAAEGAIP